jgi:hypothetical protein
MALLPCWWKHKRTNPFRFVNVVVVVDVVVDGG